MPPLGKEMSKNRVEKFLFLESPVRGAGAHPLFSAPGQAIISGDTTEMAETPQTPPLPEPRGDGRDEMLAHSLESSFLFDHLPLTPMSLKQGAAAKNTPPSLYRLPLALVPSKYEKRVNCI